MGGDLRVAAASPVDVGHRRDRRADEAALPARRGVDEQLELGPAIGLGGDALAVRVGERVDGDPVAGLAGGAAEELPGPLGLDRRASARGGRRRTSAPRAPSRGRAGRRRTGAASGASPRVALRKPRATAAMSGQRTPWTGPIPGAIRCWPSRYSGSARAARPVGQRGGEGVRVVRELGEGRAEGLGGVAVGGHERDGVRRWPRCGPGCRSRGSPSTGRAGRLDRRGPVSGARWRGTRSDRGARACGPRWPRRRRRSRSRARRRSSASTMWPAVSTTRAASVGDPAFGADRHARPSTGLRKSTVIRAVTPQLSAPTSAQAMTSSRIVHRIPPWTMPSQPSNRRSSVSSTQDRPGSTWRSSPRPPALSVPHAKQCAARTRSGRSASRSRVAWPSRVASDVKVLHLARLGLDEVLARPDLLAHEHREDLVGQRPRSRRRPGAASASPGSSSSPRAGRRSSRRGP